MNLLGKNVCLVGGLGGIGYETCKCLLKRNIANLVVLDLVENSEAIENLKTLNKSCEVIFIQIDLTDKKSIERCLADAVKRIKYIDILVNGAGVIDERNVELAINVNLIGVINTCLTALSHMDKKNGGRGGMIVNVASKLGIIPCPPFPIYTATKFGLIGFTRAMAHPVLFEQNGVSFMAVCPGLTNTTLVQNPKEKTLSENFTELVDFFFKCNDQEADICAENIVKALEVWKNGSLWALDKGILKLQEPENNWAIN